MIDLFRSGRGGARTELVIGIALGVILALGLIALFVFGFSQESLDAPLLGS